MPIDILEEVGERPVAPLMPPNTPGDLFQIHKTAGVHDLRLSANSRGNLFSKLPGLAKPPELIKWTDKDDDDGDNDENGAASSVFVKRHKRSMASVGHSSNATHPQLDPGQI